MTRVYALLLSFVFALVLPGCSPVESSEPTPTPAAIARAESDYGSLELSLDKTELRTVDTLGVSIRLVRKSGVTAGELVFDPETAGWTVARRSPPQTRMLDTGDLETRWSFTLEPFLDGAYQVPPAGVELVPPGNDAVRLITTPQEVKVTSVLDEGEKAELAPPRAIVEPEPAADRRPYGLVIGIVAAILVIFVAVILTRRRGQTKPEPILEAQTLDARTRARAIHHRLADRITRCAHNGVHPQTTDDLTHLIARCTEIKSPEGWVAMLHELDSAIYGPTPPTPTDLAALDRRATALLEAIKPDEPERGGE